MGFLPSFSHSHKEDDKLLSFLKNVSLMLCVIIDKFLCLKYYVRFGTKKLYFFLFLFEYINYSKNGDNKC